MRPIIPRSILDPSCLRSPITVIGQHAHRLRNDLCDAQDARRAARRRRSRTTNQTPRPRPRRLAESTLRRIARGVERFILEPRYP